MKKLALQQEAERCLVCHNPPCAAACAFGVNPAEVLRSVRFDNRQAAAEKAGGCIACGICEARCTRANLDAPVRIAVLMEHLKGGEPQ